MLMRAQGFAEANAARAARVIFAGESESFFEELAGMVDRARGGVVVFHERLNALEYIFLRIA